jgi:hypothetical protein
MEMRKSFIQCVKYIGCMMHQFLSLNDRRSFISGARLERTYTLLHRCLCVTLILTHHHVLRACMHDSTGAIATADRIIP